MVGGRSPLLLALLVVGCGAATPQIEFEIVGTFPHDPSAYTQGLLLHDGHLFESTGRYGQSSLRKVDISSGEPVQRIALDSAYFGEGLARVGSELIQLTWKAGEAFVYDLESFDLKRTHTYEGDGWGLCYDGADLYMSDGTSTIQRRDPATFDLRAEMTIREGGGSLSQLNELECVGRFLYANVYQTDRIVKIDKASGEVVGAIDLSNLPAAVRQSPDSESVLNGIAYVEETGLFFVTGKLWPGLLALRLIDTS